jgi:tol-pal system protein YbgF
VNLRRLPRPVAALVFLFALGVCLPASAQRMSTSDRLTALEQQLSAMRSGNLDLLNQIGDLKSEVQSLRGQVEELQQQLEQQKQASKTQYLDLDSRLARLEGGDAPVNAAPAPATPAAPVPATPASVPPATASAVPASSQEPAPRVYGDAAAFTGRAEDERGAYNQAFDALKAGRYADASRAFQAFLDAYPNGVFTPNAFYWLGESYYVTQNYALALEQFQTLLNRYPTHDKAAGALLKVGLCQYGLRQLDAAQVTLSKVVSRYPGTEAARSADDRLRAIQLSRVK